MKPKYIHTLHPCGFPVTFELEASDTKLKPLIDQLITYGFRPYTAPATWPRLPPAVKPIPTRRLPS